MIEIYVKYKDKTMNVNMDVEVFKTLTEMNINATKEMFSTLNDEIIAMVNAE